MTITRQKVKNELSGSTSRGNQSWPDIMLPTSVSKLASLFQNWGENEKNSWKLKFNTINQVIGIVKQTF